MELCVCVSTRQIGITQQCGCPELVIFLRKAFAF